jgi:hypothetical protein
MLNCSTNGELPPEFAGTGMKNVTFCSFSLVEIVSVYEYVLTSVLRYSLSTYIPYSPVAAKATKIMMKIPAVILMTLSIPVSKVNYFPIFTPARLDSAAPERIRGILSFTMKKDRPPGYEKRQRVRPGHHAFIQGLSILV